MLLDWPALAQPYGAHNFLLLLSLFADKDLVFLLETPDQQQIIVHIFNRVLK